MQLNEKQILQSVRPGKLSGVLIYGNDTSAVSELGRSVAADWSVRVGGAEMLRLEVSTLKSDPGRLADEYSAMSLLGDKLVILVSDCDEGCLSAVNGFLGKGLIGENLVVLMADSLSKGSKLRAACESAAHFGCVPVYEESVGELKQRIASFLGGLGLAWKQDASDTFFELIGSDRVTALREAEKLAAYCLGQSTIAEADVLAVCGQTASHSIDELCDAIFAGRAADADQLFSAIDQEPGAVLSQILYQTQRLLAMRVDMSAGSTAEAAMQRAKPPVFFKRKSIVADQLRRLDSDGLEQCVRSLSRAVAETRNNGALAPEITGREVFRLAGLAQAAS